MWGSHQGRELTKARDVNVKKGRNSTREMAQPRADLTDDTRGIKLRPSVKSLSPMSDFEILLGVELPSINPERINIVCQ